MQNPFIDEFFIVIDVESAGPNPGNYALSSIGACTLNQTRETFYIELIPDSELFTDEALRISNFSMEYLKENGIDSKEAMQKLSDWVSGICPENASPVFVAFNAPYDWMFVNEYFHRYKIANPFGYKALDIKAFYMGKHGVSWKDTSFKNVAERYLDSKSIEHHALQDAIDTADMFQRMLEDN